MDNAMNNDIIKKVATKSVAIYKTISKLPPPEFKDLWEEKSLIEHRKNLESKSV